MFLLLLFWRLFTPPLCWLFSPLHLLSLVVPTLPFLFSLLAPLSLLLLRAARMCIVGAYVCAHVCVFLGGRWVIAVVVRCCPSWRSLSSGPWGRKTGKSGAGFGIQREQSHSACALPEFFCVRACIGTFLGLFSVRSRSSLLILL